MAFEGVCVVIVSHPRTGTHLTIDFLRRNFPGFAHRPGIWASSQVLYYNLDSHLSFRYVDEKWSEKSLQRQNLIVKTHDYPFSSDLVSVLNKLSSGRQIIYIYPFRSVEKMILGYYRAFGSAEGVRKFLDAKDVYFRQQMSVEQTLHTHLMWGLEHCHLLDIDDLLKHPVAYVKLFAQQFGWEAISNFSSPLAPRRPIGGVLGEMIERIRGRQSTELVVRKPESVNIKEISSEVGFELRDLIANMRQAPSVLNWEGRYEERA